MHDLSHLARRRPGVLRQRSSTWDRTGGNADAVPIAPGETVVIAEGEGAGQVTHVWFTLLAPSLYWGRELVLRMYWDGADHPSVEVPLGDFFGVGNCLTATYTSAVLEMAPRSGLSLHSWFPMPFADGFRVTVENQGLLPLLSLYAYVDYESWPAADPELGRFHAHWGRRRGPGLAGPVDGVYELGVNLTGEDNYVLLDRIGRGTYVGAAVNIWSADGGWYGEGDDMIFVDSRAWPPTLHGTGTEDYFGTSWSPAETFSFPRYGQPVADREDWAGFTSVYRFHLQDPVPFEESILVTIEQGHANDRRDDWSSVAYWYEHDRAATLPPLPGLADRLPPWPVSWRARAERLHAWHEEALAAGLPGESIGLVAQWALRAVHARDGAAVDDLIEWVTGDRPPSAAVPRTVPDVLARTRGADEDAVAAAVADLDVAATVDAVLRYWADGVDPAERADTRLRLGVEVVHGDVTTRHQLDVTDGVCTLRPGAGGHERLVVRTDLVTLIRWTNGDVDTWEAALRGRLSGEGDTGVALFLPTLFDLGGRA